MLFFFQKKKDIAVIAKVGAYSLSMDGCVMQQAFPSPYPVALAHISTSILWEHQSVAPLSLSSSSYDRLADSIHHTLVDGCFSKLCCQSISGSNLQEGKITLEAIRARMLKYNSPSNPGLLQFSSRRPSASWHLPRYPQLLSCNILVSNFKILG